jgi:Zn-dependent M28 family amino/carboxypeptidase
MNRWAAGAFLLLIAGAQAKAELPPQSVKAASQVSAARLQKHIRYLSSDELEGRAPGSRGDRLAQRYIARKFAELGLLPAAADGSYFQPFDLLGMEGHPATLTLRGAAASFTLRHGEDFMLVAGEPLADIRWSAEELVFVGYGISAPEFSWDDFKGEDLDGKVLVVLNNDPSRDPDLFAGKTRLWYGRWDYKYEAAAARGAKGALIIHTPASAGYPWQVVRTSWSGEQFELPAEPSPKLLAKGWLTEASAKKLFEMAGVDFEAACEAAQHRAFRPMPLGVSASMRFANKVSRTKRTANVLGMVSGEDSQLAGQLVLYSAHHDHLGKKSKGLPGEDLIYNGAVDNASGVAQMLEVARVFASLPQKPRRSILFAAVAAEEQGLLGSRHLAQNLPVASALVAANINIDGANVWGRTRDVTVVGAGKSSLDALVSRIASAQGRWVRGDPFPDRGFFYRSDQFSFAKIGIPASYAEGGFDYIGKPEGWGRQKRERWETRHYHQPSDEFDPSWDFSGAIDDAQLYFHLGALVADADEMPEWKENDEFAKVRRAAEEELNARGTGVGAP